MTGVDEIGAARHESGRASDSDSGQCDGEGRREGRRVVVHLGSRTREGRVVDLSDRDLDPRTVAVAVRGGTGDGTGSNRNESVDGDGSADGNGVTDRGGSAGGGRPAKREDGRRVLVSCPDPGPVHDHVGCIRPSTTIRVRTALAAAARSRGITAPEDDRTESVRERLREVEVPSPPDLRAARERLAGTATAVEESRERVATLRGRLQAGRGTDGRDVTDLEAELTEAQRELAERETERAAAREALDRARRRARESRDARERRRRLEDRLGNLERAARASLVAAVREEFEAAVAAAPGRPAAGTGPDGDAAGPDGDAAGPDGDAADTFEVDDVTAALAVARVASLRAPVVLAVDRFETPAAAAAWLDASVVRV